MLPFGVVALNRFVTIFCTSLSFFRYANGLITVAFVPCSKGQPPEFHSLSFSVGRRSPSIVLLCSPARNMKCWPARDLFLHKTGFFRAPLPPTDQGVYLSAVLFSVQPHSYVLCKNAVFAKFLSAVFLVHFFRIPHLPEPCSSPLRYCARW